MHTESKERSVVPLVRKPDLREQVVLVGSWLYTAGLIVAADGNISVRLDNDHVLITPSGLCKGRLELDDLVVIDLNDRVVQSVGGRRPSSERLLHLQIYQARPDVQAIVHAHPPYAIAATLAGVSLAEEWLPETILTIGPVPTAPYALTGTVEMFASIEPFVANHQALLLSHHGAVTFGTTLEEAYMAMEQVEHSARILLAAQQFGDLKPLPPERVTQLRALRARRRPHLVLESTDNR